jgi:hypothetical protein
MAFMVIRAGVLATDVMDDGSDARDLGVQRHGRIHLEEERPPCSP